jgi:prophage endopeptidase
MNYIFAFLISVLIIGGTYEYGHHQGYAERDAETSVQIAKLNAENAQKTNTLVQQISDKDAELQKEKTNAKKEIAKRDADIATGKLQLYVKTAPNSSCSNAPSTSGSDSSYARIDPAFAESLVRITDDGDSAIRKLNACLQIYNQVRTMINGFPNPR